MGTVLRGVGAMLGVALIAGCGGGGGSSSSSSGSGSGSGTNASDVVYIKSLKVYGTSATGTDGFAPVSPYVSGGEWTFEWTTDFVHTYRADFYLSADKVLDTTSGSPDMRILGRNCQETQPLFMVCGYTGNALCTLDNNNISRCTLAGQTGNLSTDSVSLYDYLDVVPKDGYLIMRMCDGAQTQCDSLAARVRFE